MIPKECKRLAEVDFPIALVGNHSLAEKTRRSGTPHQLHLWWSWKPLAACRAMLLGLLLPDPCDLQCPVDFKSKAREILPKVQGGVGPEDKDLRKALLKFIGDFANWDLSSNQTYLEVGRGLVKAAHPEETPLVVDPFAGGGSIPLEALRLGCETFASDLNPVACLILKVKLNDIPLHHDDLDNRIYEAAEHVKRAVVRQLSELYPTDSDNGRPIAYIWSRTVHCEAPNCGAEIPMKGSFWLCKKANRKRALRYIIENVGATHGGRPEEGQAQRPAPTKTIRFEIFEPKSESEVPAGTVTRAKATCLCCGTVLSPERVRAQLVMQRGGANVIFDNKGKRIGGARLLAVVTVKSGHQGRHYRLPTAEDYEAVWKSQKLLEYFTMQELPNGLKPIPNEPLPPIGTLGFRVQRYGMLEWGDLFTKRQTLVLSMLASNICEISDLSIRELLALAISKLAERNNALCNWMLDVECPGHLFTQQVLPPSWEFAEAVPLGDSSGSFDLVIKHTVSSALACILGNSQRGDVHLCDARELGLPDESCKVFFTDPPYYDSIPYSDLSDFFFIWLKRTLPKTHPILCDPFDTRNVLTPKVQELVQDEAKTVNGRPKDKLFWQKGMTKTFIEARRVLHSEGVGCVVFAHKTTEGWEALLEGMTKGGWVITSSWPITTERVARVRARDSAALAASIHILCRPRTDDAPVGDWGEVLRELPKRVGDWMERLQSEGIRGADLVFACIGPALEIYSRYSKVVDAEEREIPLGGDPEASEPHRKGFLAYVWEVVGRTALEQVLGTAEAKARNSTAGALEEDARLTALFLWTLQSTNGNKQNGSIGVSPVEDEDEEDTGKDAGATKKKQGYSLIFDVVRRFAQPLGIHLPEWEGRIIETEKGVVRLLSVKERTKQLFGEESISVAGIRIEEQARRDPQMKFDFAITSERGAPPKIKGHHKRKEKGLPAETAAKAGTTTLDRVHAAMLLQASGQTNALRALLKAEQDRGPEFLRLANALSALYPKDGEEKRLLDAMLLAIPR